MVFYMIFQIILVAFSWLRAPKTPSALLSEFHQGNLWNDTTLQSKAYASQWHFDLDNVLRLQVKGFGFVQQRSLMHLWALNPWAHDNCTCTTLCYFYSSTTRVSLALTEMHSVVQSMRDACFRLGSNSVKRILQNTRIFQGENAYHFQAVFSDALFHAFFMYCLTHACIKKNTNYLSKSKIHTYWVHFLHSLLTLHCKIMCIIYTLKHQDGICTSVLLHGTYCLKRRVKRTHHVPNGAISHSKQLDTLSAFFMLFGA